MTVTSYQVLRGPQGWVVVPASESVNEAAQVAGPFSLRDEAIAWIQDRGGNAESRELKAAAELRAHLMSDPALVAALQDAVRNPPTARRGRPAPDNGKSQRVAIEYYWRKRHDNGATRIIAAVAKEHGCTPDFVRKCRKEFAPIASWDDELLSQMRAQQSSSSAQPFEPSRSKTENVQDYLRRLLANGALPAKEVYHRGRIAGFSEKTIDRAKQSTGIVSERAGKVWTWKLPPRDPNS
jgi:hypothetical protein